jgi:uncharacterized protein YggT (Ycf19 family)
LLFSVMSFLRTLIVFYFWLLTLALLNRRVSDPDEIQKLVLLHLERVARWPWQVQVIAPALIVISLWGCFHPLLAQLGVINWAKSAWTIAGQGGLIALELYLAAKHLLLAVLILHLVANYVYLGSHPFWDFISASARNVVVPMRRLPLQFGKVDLTLVVGLLLILFLLYEIPWVSVPWWTRYLLKYYGVVLWSG